MKITQPHYLKLLTILLLGMLFSSCAHKIHFVTSTVVPAAEGTVKVSKDNNNNNAVAIDIIRLAPPDRLTPSRNVYVVWMETDDHGTRKIGQLITDNSLFSSELKASLHTVTPYTPKRIFITAEDDVDVRNAGSQIALTTKSF